MEPFHWTGWHTLIVTVAPALLSLFHEGVRNFLVDRVWGAFVYLFKGPKETKTEEPKLVSMDLFNEHKDGDQKTLQAILHGLDQNARVVTDAAIQVGDSAKEMRENVKLITLSQGAQREEVDRKVSEIHEKVNASNMLVSNLQGKVEAVLELAKNNLRPTG